MKIKINYLTFTIVIFAVLLLFRLLWFNLFIPEDRYIAEQGKVKLSQEKIDNNEYMYIEGQWMVSNADEITFIDAASKPVVYKGVVKSQLEVSLDNHTNTPITLHIPKSSYKTSIYINNQLVKSQEDRQGMMYHAYEVTFTTEDTNFTIEMDIGENGQSISYPFSKNYIAISSDEGIDLRINLQHSTSLFISSIYIAVILSLAVFYLFANRKPLVCYIMLLYLFPTLGELYRLVEPYIDWVKLPYNIEAKLLTIVYFLSHFVLIMLMNYLTGKNKFRYLKQIIILYALTFVVIMLMPIAFINILSIYLILFYVVWTAYCFPYVLRHVYLSRYEIYSLIFLGLCIISGLVWGVIKSQINYHIPFYFFDYLGMQLGFAGFWLSRFVTNIKKIEKAEKQKEAFLLQVSEQLSVPLNRLELDIDEQCNQPYIEGQKEKVKEMLTTVRGMSLILNNWLDYSRIKDKTLKSSQHPVDVVSMIRYVCDVMKDALNIPNLSIVVKVHSQIHPILGDQKLLSQALYNLLYFQLERMNHERLNITCIQNEELVTIKIVDANKSGSGKLNSSLEQDKAIIVQICDEIIREQGGCLEQRNNGFVVNLVSNNYAEKKHGEALERFEYQTKQKASTHGEEGMSILVYSTELNTLSTLQSVVGNSSHLLTSAHTHDTFMTLYNQQRWDLIVLDSTFADSSSLDILVMIRTRYNLIDLPVLIVLIPTVANVISLYFKQGMNDYVTRPLHAVELKYKVQTLLSTKRLVDERLQMEASLLQSQIEPHFLFNTLNSIASLSKIDVDRMVMLLEQFGQYLSRGFKKRLMKKLINLQDEIDIVRSYLYIEVLRYEPFLQVEWDIDTTINMSKVQIPPYTVQTVVENAIKHGIRKKKKGGTVKISVKNSEVYTIITVSDDGVGMNMKKIDGLFRNDKDNGIGLYNTHLRLIRKFGVGLEVSSKENEGTQVSIKIPNKY